jgi:hypothetical protein
MAADEPPQNIPHLGFACRANADRSVIGRLLMVHYAGGSAPSNVARLNWLESESAFNRHGYLSLLSLCTSNVPAIGDNLPLGGSCSVLPAA